MWIEHNAFSGIDTICRQRQDHSPCSCIALQGSDHQVGVGGDNVSYQIIHGTDVAPGLMSRVLGGFDHVQMNTVCPEVSPTHQHKHFGGSTTDEQERFSETLTLLGTHGSIVKVKVEVSDCLPFLIPDFAIGLSVVRLVYGYRNIWDMSQSIAKHMRRW